jgi:hypothetical protein
MLAITASTAPPDPDEVVDLSRVAVSIDLDRAEQGEGSYENQRWEQVEGPDEAREMELRADTGYEHITVRVGVLDTIKSFWDDERPIVRRFR